MLGRPYSERELREIAEGYIRHEVAALCGQVRELRNWTATGTFLAPVHEALLDAPLLHLLVLDDFLGTPPDITQGEVGAQDYLPGRSPTPVLTRQEREDLDAQMRLGRLRRPLAEWDHLGITAHMCEAFVGFARSLDRHPEPAVRARGAWFVDASFIAHALELELRTSTDVISLLDEDAVPGSEVIPGWQ